MDEIIDLEQLKRDAIATINEKPFKNSWDRYNQEDAFWTTVDCLDLIHSATTPQHITIALKIFKRYKYQLHS